MKTFWIAYSVTVWVCPPFLSHAPSTVKNVVCQAKERTSLAGGYPRLKDALQALETPSGQGKPSVNGALAESFQVVEIQGTRIRNINVISEFKEKP